MYPSLTSLGGGMAPNRGLGGHMAAPVNVNAPGGVNAQRGYQNAPMGVNANPIAHAQAGVANAPGLMGNTHAARGYLTAPGQTGIMPQPNPLAHAQAGGMGMPPGPNPLAYGPPAAPNQNAGFHPNFLQWLAQNRAGS